MSSPAATLDPETERLLEDWENLKKAIPRDRILNPSRDRIGRILSFLGLPYRHQSELALERQGRSAAWLHFGFETDVQSVRGAPQFGSQADGKYDIFCIWEQGRPDRITSNRRLREFASDERNAVIVFSLGPLTLEERHDIQRESWTNGLTLLVVDEVLLAHVARHGGDRFRRFLELSLPFTAANPYNPETTGWGARVAPEMFYGRQRLESEIRLMRGGTSLVFGGRQLGKTALLQHVQMGSHDREQRRFAWFIDLKAKGYVPGAAKDPQDLFEVLHSQFREDGILADSGNGHGPDHARQDILNAFGRDKSLQVLAMFDESDAFLRGDWGSGSPVVESLRDLMNATENRFKVVFAGLHNVQRFASPANNPFPNLGFNPETPRRGGIGPLEDREARNLVEEPLHLLGFRFEPLVVDRILSYTNRQASLVQFFCHELILTYRQQNLDRHPPFQIGIADVENVYRKPDIQGGIKRRFEATFDLDSRYHVIALTMIFEQTHPTQGWSLCRLRSHCRSYCPQTFDEGFLSDEEMESLLNELIGLGILTKDGKEYRMRSRLIAQMIGTEDDVLDELIKLREGEPYREGSPMRRID